MRGRIPGIGDSFLKSADPKQTREWSSKHLGLAGKGLVLVRPWRENGETQEKHVTVWSVFPAASKCMDPSPAPFMINYMVDEVDAILERLKLEGVKIDEKRSE